MIKRLFDIFISALLLVVLFPLIIIVSILVRLLLGRPILFVQTRPGLNASPFKMMKFRTMLDAYDSIGNLLADKKRLTAFGRFLRSTSLDELPELLNVLKGEMSLVGPRPLLMEYLSLYNEKQMKRHHVRPGITGLAQINGRNDISWEERFKYDVWYAENQSLWLDFKILFLTIKKVLVREGISAQGETTMAKFKGPK
jgi:lipopolysaccharide/colanic/teichoic acid biosynthesis glycosyltransferase